MQNFKERYQRFWHSVQEQELDGFLVSHPVHLAYLFNFHGSAGIGCCLGGETQLLVDSRYMEEAEARGVNCKPVLAKPTLEEALAEVLSATRPGSIKRMGLEGQHLSHAVALGIINRNSSIEWISTTDLIEHLRSVKDPAELDLLEDAFKLARKAFLIFKRQLRPGLSEIEAAGMLEYELRRLGGEGVSFDTIVASGPRSSLPHGTATSKKLRRGEVVLIDFGTRRRDYCSDLTRLELLPGARKPDIYGIVREAQQAAIEKTRPGVLSSDIDTAARDVICRAGYGEFFGHSTGHGLGMEVHEKPVISSRRPSEIREGMVFTIEPGIYLPGRIGARIEDVVVVTRNGCRLLPAPLCID